MATRTAWCFHCRKNTTQITVRTRKRNGQQGVVDYEEWKCAICGTLLGEQA